MDNKLPKKLKKEPLIDVAFEVRFTSGSLISEILPSILLSKLNGEKKFQILSENEIPRTIREQVPHLQFAPLIKITLDNYSISIGENNVVVSSHIPYLGWDKFKPIILDILGIINEMNIVKNIDRFSTKYVNFIEGDNVAERIKLLDARISIGDDVFDKHNFSLRVDVPNNDFINIINIHSSGTIINQENNNDHRNGKEGTIIETDTIKRLQNISYDEWIKTANEELEKIHCENKRMFFNSLKKETIELLEPEYE